MGRLWRVYKASIVSCIIRELEFRANFIAKIIQSLGWVIFYVIIIEVIYQNVPQVAGWNRAMGLVLGGTALINSGACSILFPSLLDVAEQVRRGTLDFVLTRPVDSQFSVSLRKIELSRVGVLVSGVVMMFYGLAHLGRIPTVGDWAAYLVCLVAGILVYYSLSFFLATLAIYFVRTDNIWVIGEMAMESARYPADVFPNVFKQIATFGLPIALLSTVPARCLVFGWDIVGLATSVVWGCLSLGLSRWFWQRSMWKYSSASS